MKTQRPAAADARERRHASDMGRVRAMRDEDIDLSEIPEVDPEWFERATYSPGVPHRDSSDMERIRAMRDEEIDLSESPEVDAEWFERAKIVLPDPFLIAQFYVTVPDAVREWYLTAPEGCQEALAAALLEYVERHPRS